MSMIGGAAKRILNMTGADGAALHDESSASIRSLAGRAPEAGTVHLDMPALVDAGVVVPPQERSPHAEEFRHMKRQLLRNARAKDAATSRAGLIMLTSALPGEGKTFCAINLALSMAAEIDTSVLLVDGDVVRPSMMKRLGVRAEAGLLDVLTSPGMKLDDVILRTNVPKLSLLPAGMPRAMSTELFASGAMEQLLVDLLKGAVNGRVVVIDAPPLLLTNEAKVLSSYVGQVLMVVKAGSTPREALAEAVSAVEQSPILMFILNQARVSARKYGYGYGHYRA